jgi:hypothetical protein
MGAKIHEDPIVSFLARKENVALAFEIGKKLPAVKDEIRLKFWRTLEAILGKSSVIRKQRTNPRGWRFEPDDDSRCPLDDSYALSMLPKRHGGLYLYPCIQQALQVHGMQLYYGISWSEEVARPPRISKVADLRTRLQQDFLPECKDDNWWLGYAVLSEDLGEAETCSGIASGSNIFESRVASDFVRLFEDTRELLENANAAIALGGRRR